MLSPLITLFLAAKLYANAAHHRATGPTFFEDHEWLGEAYAAYDAAFDGLAERAIGLGEQVDHVAIYREAVALQSSNYDAAFASLLKLETMIQDAISTASQGASIGTQNLLAQLADDSEARVYKLRQKLAA